MIKSNDQYVKVLLDFPEDIKAEVTFKTSFRSQTERKHKTLSILERLKEVLPLASQSGIKFNIRPTEGITYPRVTKRSKVNGSVYLQFIEGLGTEINL